MPGNSPGRNIVLLILERVRGGPQFRCSENLRLIQFFPMFFLTSPRISELFSGVRTRFWDPVLSTATLPVVALSQRRAVNLVSIHMYGIDVNPLDAVSQECGPRSGRSHG